MFHCCHQPTAKVHACMFYVFVSFYHPQENFTDWSQNGYFPLQPYLLFKFWTYQMYKQALQHYVPEHNLGQPWQKKDVLFLLWMNMLNFVNGNIFSNLFTMIRTISSRYVHKYNRMTLWRYIYMKDFFFLFIFPWFSLNLIYSLRMASEYGQFIMCLKKPTAARTDKVSIQFSIRPQIIHSIGCFYIVKI